SVMFTHQGLNSTHEAIYCRTPMISYPFFSDQPGLARRCQAFGLALPLAASGPRGPVTSADVDDAIARITATRTDFDARLAEARTWEVATIAARPGVLERIVGLMR
ncbi:MAG TPA: hypothetical protein VFF44_09550, partial [Casimicrobiaceae bacterium]|nr:hypothetical protein [Casimicrobiaceae bacterium]